MTDPRDMENLTGAYALDALSPEEAAEFEAYLAGTEQIRYEAIELRDTVLRLGLAVAPEMPPARVKSALFAALDDAPQHPADVVSASTEVAESAGSGASAAAASSAGEGEAGSDRSDVSTDARVTPIASRRGSERGRGRGRGRTRAIVSTVGAAVLAVAAAGAIIVGVQSSQTSPEDIAFASDVEQADAQVDGGGTLAVKWSDALDAATVQLRGADELDSDQTYELWYVGEDGARPAGLIDSSGDWVVLEGELSGGDTIAVTVEPAGGSKQPTGDPLAAVPTA
jgi:anti-sigma-K factor RskA